jgi:hypothetical protein
MSNRAEFLQSPLNIEEADGSPSLFPWKLIVDTGSLTANADNSATYNAGAGIGAGITDIVMVLI